MKALLTSISLIIISLGSISTYADEEAITLSGKRVILKKDGTWEYKKVRDVNEVMFRGIPWGQEARLIKKSISEKPLYDDDRVLSYKDNLGGLNTQYVFFLANGRFVRGRYIFTDSHTNNNLFMTDFEKIDKILKEKYGDPKEHKENWLNDLYKDDFERWGLAISMGHLFIFSEWTKGNVSIYHSLHGDNFEIYHILEYQQRNMQDLEDALKKDEDKTKL
jgi:hypothetical protein